MTYTPGSLVQATDYNTLAYETGLPPIVVPVTAKVGDIFGTGFGDYGYGGDSTNVGVSDLPTIAVSDVVQSDTDVIGAPPPGDPDEWVNLRNAFLDCATHQATVLPVLPLPSLADLSDGVPISANPVDDFDNLNSAANNAALEASRTAFAGESFTVSLGLTNARGASWSSFIKHEFTVTFVDEDDARFFFNTGGEIRISASRTGGSASPQNTAWSNLVSANSPYIFTQADYFILTTLFVSKQSVSSGGLYFLNNWNIKAKADTITGLNGGKGSVLRFSSEFTDGHVNGFFDTVDGTFTSTIDEKLSTGIFVRPSPVFATTIPLTSGS